MQVTGLSQLSQHSRFIGSINMIYFLLALCLCGAFDWRYHEIPLWGILLAILPGIWLCIQHPLISVLCGLASVFLCMIINIGTADKILFPLVSAAFGWGGIFFASLSLVLAAWHSKRQPAPGVTYLAVITTLFSIGIGGLE